MTAVDESWWTRVLAGPEGDLHAVNGVETYVVLPRPSNARVVVDQASSLAVRDALERFVSSRTSNTILRQAAGAGSSLLRRSPQAWRVSSGGAGRTLRQHLSEVIGEPVRLAVAVGPPRANRKPVIRCYGDHGVVAVAKLGPDAHTSAMVTNEGHWLDTMAENPLSGVHTPALLHAGEFGGAALLVMAAMDLRSDLGVAFEDVPISVARELTSRHFDASTTVIETTWWSELRGRLVASGVDALASEADSLSQDPRVSEIAVSAWHGDWSPWNMGRTSDGALYVWDWERAAVGVPTGFDLLHLHYQYGAGIAAADAELDDLGVPPEQIDLIKRMYLLEVCAREADARGPDSSRLTKALDELTHLRDRVGEQ